MKDIYSISVIENSGKEVSMGTYKGKVLLIVNVASQCGFTPQYEGLQKLYEKYKDQGLEILAFPCNQFGAQEPGSAAEIRTFCTTRFKTTFPLFEKIEVNGAGTHPLYQHLKSQAKGVLGSEAIKWNFTKFLVDRKGTQTERFASATKPESMESAIKALLKA